MEQNSFVPGPMVISNPEPQLLSQQFIFKRDTGIKKRAFFEVKIYKYSLSLALGLFIFKRDTGIKKRAFFEVKIYKYSLSVALGLFIFKRDTGINPSNAEANTSFQSTRMQRFLKTLSCWYSLESAH